MQKSQCIPGCICAVDKMSELQHDLQANTGHGTQEMLNDLKAAIEVNLGEGWQILYPKKGLKFEISDFLVEVRLRDDPGICGKQVLGHEWLHGPLRGPHQQAMISQSFADFSGRVARLLQNEECSVERERGRRQKLEKLHLDQVEGKFVWLVFGGMVAFVGFCSSCLLVLELEDWVLSLGSVEVAVIATVLAVFASLALRYAFNYMIATIMWYQTEMDINHGSGHDGSKILLSRALLAPFLCQVDLMTSGVYFLALVSMVVCVAGAGRVSEVLADGGYTWPIAFLWSIPCCFCIYFFYARCACQEPLSTKQYLSEIRERTARNTLKFKGNVIPDRAKACVCSWPGKYESAWQTLVDQSHDGQISAAVVFLPKGSPNFGRHDPIPSSEALWGDCWCFPLYGEQKPWGCRWWTLWAANIEKAVRCGVELQVFFFENMKGRGKVQSFTTAGAEHCQRERIWQKEKEFKESVAHRSGSCRPWQPQQRCRRRFFFTAQPGASATFLGLAARGRSWFPRHIRRTWEFPKGWSGMAGKEGLPIHPGRHYRIQSKLQEDHLLRALGLCWSVLSFDGFVLPRQSCGKMPQQVLACFQSPKVVILT